MTDTTDLLDDDFVEDAPSELEVLKERADLMGIQYSGNIGVDKLRERVEEALAKTAKKDSVANTSDQNERYNALRKEATKLIRVRVTCLNPNKKHSDGEYVRTGNRVVKTIGRFLPFEKETHLENMLVNNLRDRMYPIVAEEKNSEGKMVPIRKLRREFQIEILPQLTEEELKDLAADQARRGSV